MKVIHLIAMLSTFILVSCISIRVVPKYNPDIYNGYKVIQAYQKKETIGSTDIKQRKKDVLACGVINYNAGNLDNTAQYSGMTTEEVRQRSIRIDNCMEKKGYIIHSYTHCTLKGKPTGFCN